MDGAFPRDHQASKASFTRIQDLQSKPSAWPTPKALSSKPKSQRNLIPRVEQDTIMLVLAYGRLCC